MSNYGYRDYFPWQGRFTTVDPIKDGFNWYAYCENNPVNLVDLWGLSASDGNQKGNDNSKNIDGVYTTLKELTNNVKSKAIGSFDLVNGNIDVAGKVLSVQSFVDGMLKKGMALNTSRTLRNAKGQLMRKTGELAKRVRIKTISTKIYTPVAKRFSRLIKVAPVVSIGIGSWAITKDYSDLKAGKLSTNRFVYRATVNGFGMVPHPATAGLSIVGGLIEGWFFEE